MAGTTLSVPLCLVCMRAIVRTCDRFRLRVPKEGCAVLNKLGEILQKETENVLVDLKITANAATATLVCRHCRDIVLRIHKTREQLDSLRDQLKSKITVGKSTKSSQGPSAASVQSRSSLSVHSVVPSVLLPTQQRPTGKRPISSPASKTGFSPAPKRSVPADLTTDGTLSHAITHVPSTSLANQRYSAGVTSNISLNPCSISALTDDLHIRDRPCRSKQRGRMLQLIGSQSSSQISESHTPQIISTPIQQEVVVVKVYEDLESDPDENIKVNIAIILQQFYNNINNNNYLSYFCTCTCSKW